MIYRPLLDYQMHHEHTFATISDLQAIIIIIRCLHGVCSFQGNLCSFSASSDFLLPFLFSSCFSTQLSQLTYMYFCLLLFILLLVFLSILFYNLLFHTHTHTHTHTPTHTHTHSHTRALTNISTHAHTKLSGFVPICPTQHDVFSGNRRCSVARVYTCTCIRSDVCAHNTIV